MQGDFLIAVAAQHLALIAALRGNANSAARLLGYVEAQFEFLGYKRESTEQWSYDQLMAELHEKLSKGEIAKLSDEGKVWPEDQAAEEALKI